MPEMPFVEVAGRVGGLELWQSGSICVNIGVTMATVLSMIEFDGGDVHPPKIVTV